MSLRYPKWDCRFSHNGMQLGSTGNMNGIIDDPPILNFPTCPPPKKKRYLGLSWGVWYSWEGIAQKGYKADLTLKMLLATIFLGRFLGYHRSFGKNRHFGEFFLFTSWEMGTDANGHWRIGEMMIKATEHGMIYEDRRHHQTKVSLVPHAATHQSWSLEELVLWRSACPKSLSLTWHDFHVFFPMRIALPWGKVVVTPNDHRKIHGFKTSSSLIWLWLMLIISGSVFRSLSPTPPTQKNTKKNQEFSHLGMIHDDSPVHSSSFQWDHREIMIQFITGWWLGHPSEKY